MTDFKKIISDLIELNNAIQRRVDDADDAYGFVAINLKYFETIKDTLALLKAQEPRVMTLEEVKCLSPDDDVWIEYHELEGWTISAVTVREIYDNGILCRLQCLRFNFDRYGCYGGDWMAWRCWTSRPDEKRRADTPWN